METKKTNLSEYNADAVPSGKGLHIAIVVAEWNATVTDNLLQGAYDTLVQFGTQEKDITVVHVPGSYELTSMADHLLTIAPHLDAVICLGCVIQGETRHFDFICEAVAHGITEVSLRHDSPVIFGLLTTNNMQQALDRAGGQHGNKGVEAAVTALKMCSLYNKLNDEPWSFNLE